jgi:glycosyltransferase involved in cell wall biosynthesis
MTGSIAVDGSFWGGHERGVAVSTRRLWTAMLQRPRARAVTVFAPAAPACPPGSVSLVPVGPLSGASRFAWQQLALPALLRARGIDLLHCPCYTAPIGARCRLLVTVHDLIAWTHPALAGWRNALHLRALVGRAIRRAHAIAVPTEVVRRAIIDRFGTPSRKIFVVPWGVDAEIVPWRRDEAVLEVRRQFGVDEPFVLFCGCVEPKKNLEAVRRAAADSGLLLLMTGPSLPGSIVALARSGEGRPRRRHLGYVAPVTLGALYSAAVSLLLPSHVEGFGMPAVEAMRCGCPVIASDTPALMEVCGGAALHLRAADSVGLTGAIRIVRSDSSLRDDLVARGRARAAHFTWAAAADRFAEALAHAER